MRCKAITKADKPCRSPDTLVDLKTGYCRFHDPALKEVRRREGQKGGIESAKRWRAKGISADDLGPLEEPEDVRRWLEQIGRAVACGVLTASAGACAVRACEACLKAIDAGQMADRIKFLEGQLAEMRKLRVS